MTPGAWIALLTPIVTAGAFSALAVHANTVFPAPKARTFAEKQLMAARKAVEPVALSIRVNTLEKRDAALAAGLRVVDTVAEYGERKRDQCGGDYLCLLAWAEEKR